MGTVIRAELSENNKYWISKHRYYELKHFCLQYPIWKKAYAAINDSPGSASIIEMSPCTNLANRVNRADCIPDRPCTWIIHITCRDGRIIIYISAFKIGNAVWERYVL